MNMFIHSRQHGGDVWGLSRKYKIPLERIIDFSAPINYLGPSPRALEAIKRFADVVKFYPDQNPEELKSDICDYVGKISPDNVILGNGSMELIYLFAEIFARGQEVLIPTPSFTEYEKASLVASARPKQVSILPDFSLKTEDFKRNIGADTRLMFICNPHSPSGRLFSKESILDLVNFCIERNVYVIVDENYIDFVDPIEEYTLAHYVNKYENLFVVRSFSKFFGMPGIRIGYGIAHKKLVESLEAIRQPWCVNSLALIAAREALRDKEYIRKTKEYIQREREQFSKLLKETGVFYVFPSETNFLLVKILKKGITAGKLKEKLAEKGILIRDCGDFPGLDQSYFRITVRSAGENLTLIDVLKGILSAYI
jgi:threonine-phosphate decarboxylase